MKRSIRGVISSIAPIVGSFCVNVAVAVRCFQSEVSPLHPPLIVYRKWVPHVKANVNILARYDFTRALDYLHHTRPLLLIASFSSLRTHEENLIVRCIHFTAAQQDWPKHRPGAAPTILGTWLKEFEQRYYLFRPADAESLLTIIAVLTERGPECRYYLKFTQSRCNLGSATELYL